MNSVPFYVGRLVVYGGSLLTREERYDEDSAYYNIPIDEFIEKAEKRN